ncbi:hypothetical protein [Lysinibacillus sp. Bpr_S20]|uniref:hypothetical protein n=1 Tax=Lysinibacillus sp. Bpr_S20 TaxID=2933964 RepID=UPI002013BD2D|nr:hypothetical protein [Lysinibacillus sp. Bpr_S20]MCL1700808.1 hypothetical protein [Lysinibacillus sp. Bpr_S20]
MKLDEIGKEISLVSIRAKARAITDPNANVEAHEYEIAKIFSFSPESREDDDFSISLITRVYDRIKTKETDVNVVKEVEEWANKKGYNLHELIKELNSK